MIDGSLLIAGQMASLSERLLKLRPKNASTSGPKNRVAQLQEQAKSTARASSSTSSSKTQVLPGEPAQVLAGKPTSKRKQVEDVEGVVPKGDMVPAGSSCCLLSS